ncbi:hypothetical protein ABPG74_018197 [Tetrahymena malaccensis]
MKSGFKQSLHMRDISKMINQQQIIYIPKKISTTLFALLKYPLQQYAAIATIPEKAKQKIQMIGYKNLQDLQSYLQISEGISIEHTIEKLPHNIIIIICIKNQYQLAEFIILYNSLALYFSAICV